MKWTTIFSLMFILFFNVVVYTKGVIGVVIV